MKRYDVTVTREGKWWMVAIPEIGGLTQARRLSEAAQMASDYVAATLDRGADTFALDVRVEAVGDVKGIQEVLAMIRTDRERAAALEKEAAEAAQKLAKDLASQGVPLRDVGSILGISHQRAHQLMSA
ncbi:hypothetical protein [Diaminobutyricibacter sp. McL0608]|uniref:hypothetical protein n=1 Tax=Leifsonia sp. McL0608 TaxID=3143537 RepID=UPI0031F32946